MTDKNPSPEMQAAPQTLTAPENKPANKADKTPEKTAPKATIESEKEIGGFADSSLEEPTRFGDWEVKGRCSDF